MKKGKKMKKLLTVVKNPTESKVLMVTKADIEEMKEKYPSISMGNHDHEYLKKFNEEDVVGVVAGDLAHIGNKDADLWFVNIDYFNEHYTVIDN